MDRSYYENQTGSQLILNFYIFLWIYFYIFQSISFVISFQKCSFSNSLDLMITEKYFVS